MRAQHPAFVTPHRIELPLEERPVPRAYKTLYMGRDLGDTMPMWRVQTESPEERKGFPYGVVSPSALEDSPDGEFISSGENTKGIEAVAIGRQGNFLHWGFAASPTYMTATAKLVFINAVHYISRFSGQRAVVRTAMEVLPRAAVDDMAFGLSDEGFEAVQAEVAEVNALHQKEVKKIKIRQEAGDELTADEEESLNLPPFEWTRDEMVDFIVPERLRKRFGEDWEAYRRYYAENRAFLAPGPVVEGFRPLEVDEDAKSLGLSNDDSALLDRCVAMLESGQRTDTANRLLRRYTNESFETTDGAVGSMAAATDCSSPKSADSSS